MKKLTTIILSLFILLQNITPLQAIKVDVPDLTAKEVVIMDVANKQVIFGMNEYEQIAPASITKIMTVLVALESGVSLDTPVTIDTSLFTGIAADDAQLNFSDNEEFTLRDMLYCTAVYSANDAAIVVAQCVGGTVDNFVEMMNQKAKDIGCKNTHFVTVNGLDADGHYSTAYDMCLIMRRGIHNETFNQLFSATSYDMPATRVREAFTVYNTNNLSLNQNSSYYIDGIVSSKIGFTSKAKACEISFIQRDGRNFIVATFGGSGDEYRAQEQKDLADYFCTKYESLGISSDYSTPQLSLPFIYTSNTKKLDQFEVDSIDSLYVFSDTNNYPVTRKFVPTKLDKNAKTGDLAGYYTYYQNGEIIHKQAVYLTDAIDISISLTHILILVGITIASVLLFLLIMILVVAYLRAKSRKRRRALARARANARY